MERDKMPNDGELSGNKDPAKYVKCVFLGGVGRYLAKTGRLGMRALGLFGADSRLQNDVEYQRGSRCSFRRVFQKANERHCFKRERSGCDAWESCASTTLLRVQV